MRSMRDKGCFLIAKITSRVSGEERNKPKLSLAVSLFQGVSMVLDPGYPPFSPGYAQREGSMRE